LKSETSTNIKNQLNPHRRETIYDQISDNVSILRYTVRRETIDDQISDNVSIRYTVRRETPIHEKIAANGFRCSHIMKPAKAPGYEMIHANMKCTTAGTMHASDISTEQQQLPLGTFTGGADDDRVRLCAQKCCQSQKTGGDGLQCTVMTFSHSTGKCMHEVTTSEYATIRNVIY
jgi:hypothetical protein